VLSGVERENREEERAARKVAEKRDGGGEKRKWEREQQRKSVCVRESVCVGVVVIMRVRVHVMSAVTRE